MANNKKQPRYVYCNIYSYNFRLEGELISAFRITMESMVEASDLTRPLDREKILAIPMCKILKKELG